MRYPIIVCHLTLEGICLVTVRHQLVFRKAHYVTPSYRWWDGKTIRCGYGSEVQDSSRTPGRTIIGSSVHSTHTIHIDKNHRSRKTIDTQARTTCAGRS